jgi:hypothetical protein
MVRMQSLMRKKGRGKDRENPMARRMVQIPDTPTGRIQEPNTGSPTSRLTDTTIHPQTPLSNQKAPAITREASLATGASQTRDITIKKKLRVTIKKIIRTIRMALDQSRAMNRAPDINVALIIRNPMAMIMRPQTPLSNRKVIATSVSQAPPTNTNRACPILRLRARHITKMRKMGMNTVMHRVRRWHTALRSRTPSSPPPPPSVGVSNCSRFIVGYATDLKAKGECPLPKRIPKFLSTRLTCFVKSRTRICTAC